MKLLAYLGLLAALAALVYAVPVLWEIGIAGALGGWWWIFFRVPGDKQENPPTDVTQ